MASTADGSGARRCDSCERDVIDTTALDHEQLHALALAAQTGRVCARLELVGGRPRTRLGLAAGLAVALAGCATASEPKPTIDPLSFAEMVQGDGVNEDGGFIVGVVRYPNGWPIANAIVVLHSTALPAEMARLTDERGVYVFGDLPPGNYTIEVLAGKADVSKIALLAEGARVFANFALDPEVGESIMIGMLGERAMIDTTSASSSYRFVMD